MASQEVQIADSHARITLPVEFAEATVVLEVLSPSEIRIRKVDESSDELSEAPENRVRTLSDRDRDRFLELVESQPTANAALREAMSKRREGDG